MKVIVVSGSREAVQSDWRFVHERILEELTADLEIRVGDADGVDRLVTEWASDERMKLSVYFANWARDGRAAGPIRNRRMMEASPRPSLLLAFPLTGFRKRSPGTWSAIVEAVAEGIPVRIYPLEERP